MNKSVFDELRNNENFSIGKSIAWYRKKIKEVQVSSFKSNLLSDSSRIQTRVEPGYMYAFGYTAENASTLPYYDRFPLSFIFSFTPNGFMGINFHYLSYDVRFKLFDAMVLNANNKSYSDSDKLRLNWNMLRNASKYPHVAPAVKRYLLSNVQTKFVRIPINDWKTALLLPMDDFVGANRSTVWKNSNKMIRG